MKCPLCQDIIYDRRVKQFVCKTFIVLLKIVESPITWEGRVGVYGDFAKETEMQYATRVRYCQGSHFEAEQKQLFGLLRYL